MSNLRKIDLSGLGIYLETEANNIKPKFIKRNNDLTLVSDKMVEFCISEMEKDSTIELTPKNIVMLIQKYQESDSAIPQLATLEKYCNLCSQGFKETQIVLKTQVYDTVKDLAAKINAEADVYLKNNGVGFLLDIDKELQEDNDFEEWDWDEATGDTSTLLDTLYLDTKVGNLNTFNVRLCTQMMNHLPNNYTDSLNIPEEAKIKMVNKLMRSGKYDSDNLTKIINLLTIKERYHTFYRNHFRDIENLSPMETCKLFSNTIKLLYPVLEDIEGESFDVAEDTEGELRANLKHVKLACDIMKYYLVCRRSYFKESILLDTTTINNDVKEAYLKFNELKDLHTFVKVNHIYKNIPVQHMGIVISTITDNKARYEAEYTELKNKILSNKRDYKNKATSFALDRIITSYLKDTDVTTLPKNMSKDQYVNNYRKTAMAMLTDIVHYDGNIEDMLYKFIIILKYAGTSIEHMFNMYKTETIAATENMQNGTIDTIELEANICSKLVSEFFLKNFVS